MIFSAHGVAPDVFDEVTLDSLIKTLNIQAASGYNLFDIYGLFATWGWPTNLADAATPERVTLVRRFIEAAHERGIKVVYGLGVYSWGFDEIIKQDEGVRGPNPHAMCGSKEGSWQWQQKLVDFILEYDLDGFHLESADLGRCTCDECMTRWPHQAAYHNYITSRTAQYIRGVRPDAYICVTLISWADWNTGLTDQDKDALVELSKSVDSIVDQGHHSCYLKEAERKAFIERLECRYGTSGGVWVYPPFRWHRLNWFLPYARRTGTHMKALFEDGGRTVMYYQGPTNNPGVEANIAFGGRLMCNVDASIEQALGEALEPIYKPKTPAALEGLVQVFLKAEEAYFGNLDHEEGEDARYLKGLKTLPKPRKAPGEMHLSFPGDGASGPPVYLFEPYLTDAGRIAYKDGLTACLKDAIDLRDSFDATDKMDRLRDALLLTLTMVKTIVDAQDRESAAGA